MKPLKLTMSGLFVEGWHPFPEDHQVPMLMLAGRWLWEAGFGVGTRVRVDVLGEGRVVVTRVEPGEDTHELAPVVWLKADDIGKLEAACAREVAHA